MHHLTIKSHKKNNKSSFLPNIKLPNTKIRILIFHVLCKKIYFIFGKFFKVLEPKFNSTS